MGTAQVQGALWGARAREWADLQERAFGPMYEAAFDAAGVRSGITVLDVGCGAGLALSLARDRGAIVSGIDAAAALIEIARSRCPGCDIQVGELEQLPFADESFDVVTGFNSFQYAADRAHGLEEAGRVLKPARSARHVRVPPGTIIRQLAHDRGANDGYFLVPAPFLDELFAGERNRHTQHDDRHFADESAPAM